MNELMAPQKNFVGQTDQWLDSQLDGWVDKLIDILTHRQAKQMTDRKICGWKGRWMDRKIDR